VLDDRHVLVGGGVIDGPHAEAFHRDLQPPPVDHRTQQRNQLDRWLAHVGQHGPQLLLDGVQGVFGAFEQHEPARTQRQDLPAQFAADRTARAGDHDHLATHPRAQQGVVRLNRIAAEDVRDIDFAKLVDAPGAAGQFRQGGHIHDPGRQPRQRFQDVPPAAVWRRRQRQQDELDFVVGEQPR